MNEKAVLVGIFLTGASGELLVFAPDFPGVWTLICGSCALGIVALVAGTGAPQFIRLIRLIRRSAR